MTASYYVRVGDWVYDSNEYSANVTSVLKELEFEPWEDMAMLEPEAKLNKRIYDKKSRLEALKDFNREHVENPMSNDKRRRLKAKRKKK